METRELRSRGTSPGVGVNGTAVCYTEPRPLAHCALSGLTQNRSSSGASSLRHCEAIC